MHSATSMHSTRSVQSTHYTGSAATSNRGGRQVQGLRQDLRGLRPHGERHKERHRRAAKRGTDRAPRDGRGNAGSDHCVWTQREMRRAHSQLIQLKL